MDERESDIPSAEEDSITPAYKDRSTGLLIFGVLTILLGCLAGLFVPLMLLGQAIAAKTNGAPTPLSALLPGMIMYGVLAVALVWLGIGSIQARRWARALLLIFSWSWLVIGVSTLVFMLFLLPETRTAFAASAPSGRPAMPAAFAAIAVGIMYVFTGFFFIVLPAIWTFFYGSRHVKATCEALDPVTRWTDARPLPVLAICLWLAISVPMMLLMPVTMHGATPFFGKFITGVPGALFYFVAAVVWAYAAWSIYRLESRGWWVILIALVVFLVSGLLTYSRHDVAEICRLMGYSDAQIDQIRKTGLLAGNRMSWMMVLFMVPFFGFLFYVKRFLRRHP